MYLFICVVYVQSFYKIFRFRVLNYNNLSGILKKKDYFINKGLNKFKEVRTFFNNILNSSKLNKNNKKNISQIFK